MIQTPQIAELPARTIAVVRLLVPRTEIEQHMDPAVRELYGTAAAQGIVPAGPFFTHHFRRPSETFDFEAGIPVSSRITPTGRVQDAVWPAMRVARTVYQGPYEGLGGAWGEFIQWVSQQQLAPSQELWEVYLQGPESSPDSATWRTELNLPLL
jgi:effector-binding domain-containing protein